MCVLHFGMESECDSEPAEFLYKELWRGDPKVMKIFRLLCG